ncbi:rhodanese-like domain-containing protein [Halopseudomonas salegens]|uniref:Rhodanese-related sulfurtransferase n=1 Tax=Halopseudomonas salegens TaxID=1434072 RepID=A0A1H2HHL0_9GAMM|nr:rhodanese-like domain-containing protein [Halopseudomonas salegens]SDU31272.1 Rhodanese-related sulfurtransferase [Halopseudomonas salegens]
MRLRNWLLIVVAAMATNLSAEESGLTPQQTAYLLQQQDEAMLFIDVRDPVEIMFVGTPLGIDANIPYLLVDRYAFDSENNRFQLNQNPDFAAQVAAALDAKGLGKDALVVTLCRSGSERGEPSANYLREQGFTNVRYVINGFQGSAHKDGAQEGLRTLNGWQNDGLPWQPQIDPDTIYRP